MTSLSNPKLKKSLSLILTLGMYIAVTVTLATQMNTVFGQNMRRYETGGNFTTAKLLQMAREQV
jgi:hypothetical protein